MRFVAADALQGFVPGQRVLDVAAGTGIAAKLRLAQSVPADRCWPRTRHPKGWTRHVAVLRGHLMRPSQSRMDYLSPIPRRVSTRCYAASDSRFFPTGHAEQHRQSGNSRPTVGYDKMDSAHVAPTVGRRSASR